MNLLILEEGDKVMNDYPNADGSYGLPWPIGTKLIFLNKNGYDYQLEEAREKFVVGKLYTVVGGNIFRNDSVVEFEEVEGEWNTVMFAESCDSEEEPVMPVKSLKIPVGESREFKVHLYDTPRFDEACEIAVKMAKSLFDSENAEFNKDTDHLEIIFRRMIAINFVEEKQNLVFKYTFEAYVNRDECPGCDCDDN